jgi:parallel beta-helix repeat protein/predicted outer membrane repeat protein
MIVILLAPVSVAAAGTINVPGDSTTIQAGINGASDGDTVLVADGTYTGTGNRDIDFLGKAIVVKSQNGPASTVIDCQGDSVNYHRGFYFQNSEDSTSVLMGFTITNGWYSMNGGGIYCYYSSPTIVDNIITGNTANVDGGGISCLWASPIILNNTITYNTARNYYGGGILCRYYSSPVILGNTITDNSAECGGGIGVWSYYSSPVIESNTISNNTAIYGGGIWSSDGSPTIEGNVITGNTASTYGGGIYATNYSYLSVNCNTIADNTTSDGGGIYLVGYSSAIVNSCIVWGDTVTAGNEISLDYTCSIGVSYSDIDGGWSGYGNIDQDPMFVNPSSGNYDISAGSPCIDGGDPIYNVPRGGACRIDMGAYEFWQGIDCHKVPIQYSSKNPYSSCTVSVHVFNV